MRSSARKKAIARGTRICDARKLRVRGSALFPLKGATRTDHDESNGIALAGDLRQRLCANSGTLREGQER